MASEELKVAPYQKEIVSLPLCVHVSQQRQIALHTAFICLSKLGVTETVLGKTMQKLEVTPAPT